MTGTIHYRNGKIAEVDLLEYCVLSPVRIIKSLAKADYDFQGDFIDPKKEVDFLVEMFTFCNKVPEPAFSWRREWLRKRS